MCIYNASSTLYIHYPAHRVQSSCCLTSNTVTQHHRYVSDLSPNHFSDTINTHHNTTKHNNNTTCVVPWLVLTAVVPVEPMYKLVSIIPPNVHGPNPKLGVIFGRVSVLCVVTASHRSRQGRKSRNRPWDELMRKRYLTLLVKAAG